MEHPQAQFHKADLKFELEAGGWCNLMFNQFGDDQLNYNRFKKGYEPSAAFSFVVCSKKWSCWNLIGS